MTKSLFAAVVLASVFASAAVAAESCCPSGKAAAGATCPAGMAVRDDVESRLLAKLNDFRKGKGLPALTVDDALSAGARQHACAIACGKAPFSPQGLTAKALAGGSGRAVGQVGRTTKSTDASLATVVDAWTGATSPLAGAVSKVGLAVVEKKGSGFTYAMVSLD
jgi:uncharacterized protein YkwD